MRGTRNECTRWQIAIRSVVCRCSTLARLTTAPAESDLPSDLPWFLVAHTFVMRGDKFQRNRFEGKRLASGDLVCLDSKGGMVGRYGRSERRMHPAASRPH